MYMKVVYAVVMDHLTIRDGFSIEGSAISSNAQFQRASCPQRFSGTHAHSLTHISSHDQCCSQIISAFHYFHGASLQVESGFIVTSGSKHKGEFGSKKEK